MPPFLTDNKQYQPKVAEKVLVQYTEAQIDHMIEQLPELGITKKVETRTVHYKDSHLDEPVGTTRKIIVYRTMQGNDYMAADIVFAYKLNQLLEKNSTVLSEVKSNRKGVPA